MVKPETLARIRAAIKAKPPIRRVPNLKKRKPTDTRACAYGKTWFATTSLFCIAIVDTEDAWLLLDYKWTAHGSSLSAPFYAVSPRYAHEHGTSDKLHRAVMNNSHEQYDHRNGNGHDCRRTNLRPCSDTERTRNVGKKEYVNSSSRFKGVTRHGNGWRAQITVDREHINLGIFYFELDAAIAFNYAAAH